VQIDLIVINAIQTGQELGFAFKDLQIGHFFAGAIDTFDFIGTRALAFDVKHELSRFTGCEQSNSGIDAFRGK
jgi:hypothetical protein